MKPNIEAGKHLLKAKKSFLQFLFMIFLSIFIWTCWDVLAIGNLLFIITLKLFTVEGLRVITTGLFLLAAFILFIDGVQELGVAEKELKREKSDEDQTFNYKFKYKDE